MSGVLTTLVGSGGSPFIGSATIVTAYDGTFYGYRGLIGVMGSLTPNTWGGSKIFITAILANPNGSGNFQFVVQREVPNTGWETMTVGLTVFSRVDASYSSSGGFTSWVWSPVPSNPLPSAGYTTSIVWA